MDIYKFSLVTFVEVEGIALESDIQRQVNFIDKLSNNNNDMEEK